MPLLKLQTSVSVPPEGRDALLTGLSKIVANAIGKPESYVMVTLTEGPICMGAEVAKGAFADVRSIGGLNAEVNRAISEQVCGLLTERLDIPAERIYLNFTDVGRSNWGWNSGTFG